ncbi:hypothetical protein L1987_84307 [Smallanthus sonchifolius]|uniref:Uncharacterized protein n=1 Tax=Smallanthus sonchifolius TaxID=185202 RepID=A0ACB8YDQ5_9ASTR|nr:hypothetical protein L1987_84307 [Smallanthus sonchifolius]
MGSSERPKKKVHLWKKAIVHFLVCFIVGFVTGFAPTNKPSFSTSHVVASNGSQEVSPPPKEISTQRVEHTNGNFDGSVLDESFSMKVQERPNLVPKEEKIEKGDMDKEVDLTPRRLVIIVTPTNDKDELRGVLLRKMANTLSLVPPPLLWVVVESQTESTEVSDILRKTNVMYRHLVFKENFTDVEVELDYQRNVALKHIEYHKLSGIVHFASLYNVYDLSFFDEIRTIEVFGTWPMAFLSANRQRVRIEGPVCDSSEVIGWHLKSLNNSADYATRSPVHISTVGFNSSILWDPERWGRLSSAQHTSQNSIKFVKEEVLEEETKLKGIPEDGCSKVMLWNLHIPRVIKDQIRVSFSQIREMEDSAGEDLEVKRSGNSNDDVLSQCDDLLIAVSSSSTVTVDRSSGPGNEIGCEQTGVETAGDKSSSEDSEEMPKLIETPEPERSRKNVKFNLRKSLAWDSAFFTSDGVLDADELSTMIEGGEKGVKHQLPGIEEEVYRSMDSISTLESDNLSLDCLEAELFEDIRASIQKSNKSSHLNNSSIKVSSGKKDYQPKVNSCVLDADVLPTISEGCEKVVKHQLPRIKEEVYKSMDSISTLESDNLSLDCLEAEIFGDIRASIQKSNKSSNLNNSSMKVSSGKKDSQQKISSSSKKVDLGSGKRLGARTNDNTLSIPQPKIINKLNLNMNATSTLTKRASLSANAKKDQVIAKKVHVAHKGTQTAKPTTIQGSKVTGVIGPRRAVPKPSISSKSSSLGSLTTLKTDPTRPSSSSSSCSSGTYVKVKFSKKKVDSGTPKLTAGSMIPKTPSRISMDNKQAPVSSNFSSSISPASSISDWSPESRSSSIDTSVSYRSFDGDTSVHSALSMLPTPRVSNPNGNQTGSLSRPPAVQPTGLRMPSPKIGFFDGGKTGVRTPTGGVRSQSRLPNGPTSSNSVKFGKIPPPKAAVSHTNMKPNPQKTGPKPSQEQPTSKPKTKSGLVTSDVLDHNREASLNTVHNVDKDSNNASEVLSNECTRTPFAVKNSASDTIGTGMEVTEKTVNFPLIETQKNV